MRWTPVSNPPTKRGEYVVFGPEVSQRIGGKYAIWFWDGMWMSEGGTEYAVDKQLPGAFWTAAPEPPTK